MDKKGGPVLLSNRQAGQGRNLSKHRADLLAHLCTIVKTIILHFPVTVVVIVVVFLRLVDVELHRGRVRFGRLHHDHVPSIGDGVIFHPVVVLVSRDDRIGVALNPHLQV